MMITMNAVHSQADAHRGDLMAAAGQRRSGSVDQDGKGESAARRPVADRRAVGRSRTIVPRIGTWLIEFGTRLGGASIRTS